MKFALHNYGGTPTQFFTVQGTDASTTSSASAKAPSHHIAVIDVSGSMWVEIDSVKSIVEKVFTAEEFNDPSLKISLLTYSSSGDVRTHFTRVTVADVLAPNSPHLREIRGLRVRGLTCISQALVAAEALLDDKEATCISLHTDGYANDRSPYAEAHAILAAVDKLATHPNVFCNTVAYRSWSDFALLSAISNRLSGSCTQAMTARQVYDALHSSQTLLAGTLSPTVEAGIGDFDFITFVSKSGKKVLGGTETLNVRGLAADDDKTVYRYREVSESDYKAAADPVCGDGMAGLDPILAYCRIQMALGNLNAAKYAMISTRVTNLINGNARALVANEVAAMAADVEKHLFVPTTVVQTTEYGLGATGPSVLTVLNLLAFHKDSIRVNVADLTKGYQRRGLKRIPGTRDDQGNLVPPTHKLITPSDNTRVAVASIDINRDTATANIKLVKDGTLVSLEPDPSGNAGKLNITEIAGIKLNLKSFRNYTVVGDGAINTPVIPFRTSDKRLFGALKQFGLVSGTFDPEAQIDLNISDLPLVDYDEDFATIPEEVFASLASLSVLQKLLSGLTKGTSEAFTADQVAALKACYVSPALYFTPPTTNGYTDLETALNQGEVDTRLSYKVKLGTPDITNLGKLRSGNAYLQRRFTLTNAKGNVVKKPTLMDWWDDGNVWAIKALSAKTKLDGVDAISYPIYEGFLGLGDDSYLHNAFMQAKLDYDARKEISAALKGGLDRDECVEVFKMALREVDKAIDTIYKSAICPLAFYVGATGLVPDSFGASAMTADKLVEKHPATKLAKAEKEGTFYELPGGLILGVFVKGEHFTTERGLQVIAG